MSNDLLIEYNMHLLFLTTMFIEGHFKIKQPSKFIKNQALTQHFC